MAPYISYYLGLLSEPVVRHPDILKKPFRLAEICSAIKKQLQTP